MSLFSKTSDKKENDKVQKQTVKKEKTAKEAWEKEYEKGVARLRDLIAPAALNITPRYLELSGEFVATLFAFVYPRFLQSTWLAPLINLDLEMDISMFIYPMESGVILKNLKKRAAQVQASISMAEEKGQVRDPQLETAFQDIEDLRDRLVQGTERFYKLGLYFTVHGRTKEELEDGVERIEGILESKLVYVKPAVYQMEQGFVSSLPLGHDVIQVNTNMNTSPLSSTFPFVSSDLTSNSGILYGINRHNNSLIIFDRFSLENANTVIFAKSGAGKSVRGNEPVLVRENGNVRLSPIRDVVEELIRKHGITYNDEELEGVALPNVEVYAFDNNLRGDWSRVTVAARKAAPKTYYRFRTRSGREITTTGDHNMLALRKGQVRAVKSTEIQKGEYVPLPRAVRRKDEKRYGSLNLLTMLQKNPRGIYVRGAASFIAQHYDRLKSAAADPNLDRYLPRYRTGRAMPLVYFANIVETLGMSMEDMENDRITVCPKNGKQAHAIPASLPLTPAFFRLLGYIVAEGAIGKDSVTISAVDYDVQKDISAILSSLHVPHFATEQSVVVASRVFVNLLHALQCVGTAATKRVPPFVFNGSPQQQAGFLAGYFEGDGGVERSSIVASSKSKHLINDISYLLYTFGIVTRIAPIRKMATNGGWNRKRRYWTCAISGRDTMRVFENTVGFTSRRKQKSLRQAAQGAANTNVDLVPETEPLFQELNELFGFQLNGIPEISVWKRGIRTPSRTSLLRVVNEITKRVAAFQALEKTLQPLGALPRMDAVLEKGRMDKTINRELWKTLGQSWRAVKHEGCKPYCKNAFTIISATHGTSYDLQNIKQALSTGFRACGIPVKEQRGHLQSALTARPRSNTKYETIRRASHTVWQKYQHVRRYAVPRVEEILANLRQLAESDLFWDEIVAVENIPNKRDAYVYDLTVDNEVFLAGYGGMFVHNSYTVKLEILRSMMFGVDVIAIDPENEYRYLAQATGGSFIRISIASDYRINPFDLPPLRDDDDPEDVLRETVMHITGLIAIMVDGLTAEEKSIVDQAVWETYAMKDITINSTSFDVEPPTLEDFYTILADMEGGKDIATRLQQYVTGTYAGVFNRKTNIDLETQLVVFNLRDMEEQLRPTAMYVVLQFIWKRIRANMKKRILVIDEAWVLMQHDESAQFVFGMAKRARKYFLGVTTITQDITDFLRSRYGKPIVTNSSIQILLRQSPAAVDLIADTFYLTEGEKHLLLESDVGEGLFFAGLKHVAIKIVASYAEDQIITSDPQQVLEIEAARKEMERKQLEEQEDSFSSPTPDVPVE